MVAKFADNARATRDKNAFAIFRGAFTTTLTADGVALCSTSHVTIDGPVVSNRVAGNSSLSDASLNTAIVQMMEMVSQDGVVMGQQPACLLVPPALFKLACQIVESELVSDTSDNAMNVYSSKYGIKIFQSPYLGAAQGGSDTAWFLLSRNHSVSRYVREEVSTSLVDFIYSNNNNYVYKGLFREVYGASDYVGVVGSDGTNV